MGRKGSKGGGKKGRKKQKTKSNSKKESQRPPASPSVPRTDLQNFQNGQASQTAKNETCEPRWTVLGLSNLRNTCFFNSALQMLMSSSTLQKTFLSEDCKRSHPSTLTIALSELFESAYSSSEKRIQIKPSRALGVVREMAPAFKSRGQHDAHELLITLLHILVEEARQGKMHWMEHAFGGKLMSKIQCDECQFIKRKEENFLVLSISVMQHLPFDKGNHVDGHAVLKEHPVIDLPDVVERNDSESLKHLNPRMEDEVEEVKMAENVISESEMECLDLSDALQHLFDLPEENENAFQGKVLSAKPLEKKADEAFVVYVGKGKRKGKGKKDKFQRSFDFEEDEIISKEERFENIEDCLNHFFSKERVTWRCTGPKCSKLKKRVSFSNASPEVFVLPPDKESRIGHWEIHLTDSDTENESSDEEVKTLEEEIKDEDNLIRQYPDLKPCIKNKDPETTPPIATLNSTKQYCLWTAPKVLCIHLKRFQASCHRNISKLNHNISFGMTLDLMAFTDSEHASTSKKYELKAVVCHSGTANFGHYTAYVSRTIEDRKMWYDVSDQNVRKASEADVLKCQAYLLLYEEEECVPPSEPNTKSDLVE